MTLLLSIFLNEKNGKVRMVRYSQRLYIMFLMEMAQRFSIDHDFLPKKKKSNALLYQRRGVHSILRLDFTFLLIHFVIQPPLIKTLSLVLFFFFFFGGGGGGFVFF